MFDSDAEGARFDSDAEGARFDSDAEGARADRPHPFDAVLRRAHPDVWFRSGGTGPIEVLFLDGRTGRHPARTARGTGIRGRRGDRVRTAGWLEENRGDG